MHEKKNPNRPLIVYYIIALVVVMLLNALLFPRIERYSVKQVEYSEFLTMLEEGKIKEVQIDDTQISFMPTEQAEDGKVTYYTTNRVTADEQIVERLIDAGVTFGQVVPEEMSPIISFLVSWVLPLVIFYALGSFMFRKMSQRMGGNTMSFGKSNAKIYVEAQTGKTFDDVAGEDEAKDALKEIVDFLHDPQKYRDIGARLPKGALLVGPPGTGKTLLAKAVAGEAKVPFFSISGSEFVEMFVGMGAARVRDLFKQAGEKAPCIVFIDEIDAIGKRRDNAGMGGNDEREQTLNQLLTEMDGFDAGKGVVILAATNRPEILDKALLRPGRFDRRVPVELPDLAGREAILRVHAKDVKTEPNIDYTQIARATSGCSGAELANMVNEAAIAAVISAQECRRLPARQADGLLPRDRPRAGGGQAGKRGAGAEDHHHSAHIRRAGLHHAGGRGRAAADDARADPGQDHHVLRRARGRGARIWPHHQRREQRHRAGDQARPCDDHAAGHERYVWHDGAGDAVRAVPHRRRTARLFRPDGGAHRRGGQADHRQLLRAGDADSHGQQGKAARAGQDPAGAGDDHGH